MNPARNLPASASPASTGGRRWPDALIVLGGAGVLAGLWLDARHAAFAWLLAFLFYLSLSLGALFLVLMHHLFDAAWSAPLRRVCEHLAALVLPWLALAFLPVAAFAPRIYETPPPAGAPALAEPAWLAASAFCFVAWWWLTRRLRFWSLEQDRTGAVECTRRLRTWSGAGLAILAITLTLAAVLWLQGLTPQWVSTIFPLGFFAGSVWVAVAAVYLIALALRRNGVLAPVLSARQFYFLGIILFAFTILHAYLEFSQYLIIWNANLPAETFWFGLCKRGTWFAVGLVLVFGHFLLPFLALMRMDLKLRAGWMAPLCAWIGLMQWLDLAFCVQPVLAPAGWPWQWAWLDAACLALLGGILAKSFQKSLAAHAPFPVNDPRLAEALAETEETLGGVVANSDLHE
jgi:hypothetical protein